MPRRKKRPLWTCPKCRHKFVTRNMSHSCGNYRLADHFKAKDPVAKKLFQEFRALVRNVGPAKVYAQKTRIVFQTRARFASVIVRKSRLEVGLWLKRRREHPRLYRIEFYPPSDYVHRIRIARIDEMDRELSWFVKEAYKVGRQEGPVNERRL
jgi:Domain of unknown function (DUF5655)